MKGVRFEIPNNYGQHLHNIVEGLIDESWVWQVGAG
ncbi:DUF2691 family protein [Metasolibacillus meyeri]|nr:DUF2691 family protein [Metasolibacillus meyeri]